MEGYIMRADKHLSFAIHKVALLQQEDENWAVWVPTVGSVVPVMCELCCIEIWQILGEECIRETNKEKGNSITYSTRNTPNSQPNNFLYIT